MTTYTNAQQKVLDRINAASRGRNDYKVTKIETNEYNKDLWISVHNGEEHCVLSETFYLTVGPRGGVTITGCCVFRIGDAQERWDAEKVSCSLLNYTIFNGNAKIKFFGKRPTKAEAVAAKQAAEERLAAKAEAELVDAEKTAEKASEELTEVSTEVKPQLNEYYAVFTLSGELKLVEKLRDSHELEIEIYAYDLDDAKEQFKAHKKFLESEGLMDAEFEEEAEEEAEELTEVVAERTDDSGYNGWTNYETWKHNLEWVDGNQEYWEEMIPTLDGLDSEEWCIEWDTVIRRIAMGLEDEFQCHIDDNVEDSYAQSILRAYACDVNWYEIASHIVNDYKSNLEWAA